MKTPSHLQRAGRSKSTLGPRSKMARFANHPSEMSHRFFTCKTNKSTSPEIGTVRFDVAYGGAFYAFVEAAPLGLSLTANDYSRLIDYGRRIKNSVAQSLSIKHPFEDDLSFLRHDLHRDRRLNQAITVEMFASLLRAKLIARPPAQASARGLRFTTRKASYSSTRRLRLRVLSAA